MKEAKLKELCDPVPNDVREPSLTYLGLLANKHM
jgi:hypothetical protein